MRDGWGTRIHLILTLVERPMCCKTVGERGSNAGAGPVHEEQCDGADGEAFGDVAQYVMAGFVAAEKEDFVAGKAVGQRVPNDDALGGADAADIGVKAVCLEAGLH